MIPVRSRYPYPLFRFHKCDTGLLSSAGLKMSLLGNYYLGSIRIIFPSCTSFSVTSTIVPEGLMR